MNTVNVIEWFDDTIKSLRAFPDDNAGNVRAEQVFRELGQENNLMEDEIEWGLEEGYVEKDGFRLYIVHSEP